MNMRVLILMLILTITPSLSFASDKTINISNSRLLDKLVEASMNGDDKEAARLKKEVVKRHAVKEAVESFKKSEMSDGTLYIYYQLIVDMRSSDTDKLMKPLANLEKSETAYFANYYFAKVGKRFALYNLNRNYYKYPVSSFIWADAITLFGKYRYYPARENMRETISAASLNAAEAAIKSLEMMYPETKKKTKNFKSMEELQNFYEEYFRTHKIKDLE